VKLATPLPRTEDMNAETDYARIVDMLAKQPLAAYVAYDARDDVNGLGKADQMNHIVVRVSDGKVVSGHSNVTMKTGSQNAEFNPITHPAFKADCYRATSETPASYDGVDAVKFALVATCKEPASDSHEYPFTTLFADAKTLHPLYAIGSVPETDDDKNVAVSVEEQFGDFGGRVLPTLLKVDISGSGIMFWLQVHVREAYANYRFLNTQPSS
jgi:hypothetical protein